MTTLPHQPTPPAAGGDPRRQQRANGVIVASCVTFVAAMVGASYAAVPLYNLFCRVTGYNGTTQRVEQVSDTILDRTMRVTFDANTGGGLPGRSSPSTGRSSCASARPCRSITA